MESTTTKDIDLCFCPFPSTCLDFHTESLDMLQHYVTTKEPPCYHAWGITQLYHGTVQNYNCLKNYTETYIAGKGLCRVAKKDTITPRWTSSLHVTFCSFPILFKRVTWWETDGKLIQTISKRFKLTVKFPQLENETMDLH